MTSFLRISEKNWFLRLTGMFYFFLRKTVCSLIFFSCVASSRNNTMLLPAFAATCFYSFLTTNFLIFDQQGFAKAKA